ncbi:MAG: hypothetical protein MUF06_19450 [Pirellulaceae bacterium]|nr:hypothetical protein [Pirellulaceae bacterium]
MAEPFDPYRKWLGIPPHEQPPNHYRLLGIALFEHDPDVIEHAANRQMSHIRTFQGGKNAAHSQRILSELSAAKLCLLTPDRKTKYDSELRAKQRMAEPVPATPVEAIPVEAVPVAAPLGVPPLPTASRARDERWRTDEVPDPHLAPPPVPIPMPVGTAVAPLPVIRGRSANVILARRQKSRFAVIMIVTLAVLMVAGVVAAVMIGQQLNEQEATSRTGPKGAVSASAAAPINDAGRKSAGDTPMANMVIEGESPASPSRGASNTQDTNSARSSLAAGAASSTNVPPVDRVRQAIFLAQEALADRDEDAFVRQITRAEQDLAGGRIDQFHRDSLQRQVDELRAISKLVQSFWQSVREGVHDKLSPGEPVKVLQHELVLVAREGDVVELKIDGQEHRAAIAKLDPLAAASVAGRNVQLTEPASLLPILAFLSVDRRAAAMHGGNPLVQFGRRLAQEQRFHQAQNAESLAELAVWLQSTFGEQPENR